MLVADQLLALRVSAMLSVSRPAAPRKELIYDRFDMETFMTCNKYLRRARNAQWADGYLRRAVEAGHTRRALRAAGMILALENWLNQNAPFDVATYATSSASRE
jgi:hypothetical protein